MLDNQPVGWKGRERSPEVASVHLTPMRVHPATWWRTVAWLAALSARPLDAPRRPISGTGNWKTTIIAAKRSKELSQQLGILVSHWTLAFQRYGSYEDAASNGGFRTTMRGHHRARLGMTATLSHDKDKEQPYSPIRIGKLCGRGVLQKERQLCSTEVVG